MSSEEEITLGGDVEQPSEVSEIEEEEIIKVKPPVEDKEEKDALNQLKNQFNAKTGCELRLIKDLRSILKMDQKELGFTATPINRNLNNWDIKVYAFDEKSEFAKDIAQYQKMTGKNYIQMVMSFPPNYPTFPPFIRVVQPRFQQHTGRVTIGGSLCADVLTMSGWKPLYDISSLISNLVAEMLSSGPRIDFADLQPYSLEDAKNAFVRVAGSHGWEVSRWLPS